MYFGIFSLFILCSFAVAQSRIHNRRHPTLSWIRSLSPTKLQGPYYTPQWESTHRDTKPIIDITDPNFKVLAIETSCDDTALAILKGSGEVIGNVVIGQSELTQQHGGVHPLEAKKMHESVIHDALQQVLHQSGIKTVDEIDVIAVTLGPGLELCLRVGCDVAGRLCKRFNKPLIGVHHLEGHILSCRIPQINTNYSNFPSNEPQLHYNQGENLEFPFLALIVSGGHTQLVLAHGIANYTILGCTLDDAIGEAIDKVARILNLPIGNGGGVAIEKLAQKGCANRYNIPLPFLNKQKSLHFSFAGMKNALKNHVLQIQSILNQNLSETADLAASFQNAIFNHVQDRVKYAMQLCDESLGIHDLACVGGVACNQELLKQLQNLCFSRSVNEIHVKEYELKKKQLKKFIKTRRLSNVLDTTPCTDFEFRSWINSLSYEEYCQVCVNEKSRKNFNSENLFSSLLPVAWKSWNIFSPPPSLCRDNAVMIAWAAIEKLRFRNGVADKYDDEIPCYPRWPMSQIVETHRCTQHTFFLEHMLRSKNENIANFA